MYSPAGGNGPGAPAQLYAVLAPGEVLLQIGSAPPQASKLPPGGYCASTAWVSAPVQRNSGARTMTPPFGVAVGVSSIW